MGINEMNELSDDELDAVTGGTSMDDAKRYEKMTHTVAAGESLSTIAAKYGMSTEVLYARNIFTIGKDPNHIEPGQVLTVYKKK